VLIAAAVYHKVYKEQMTALRGMTNRATTLCAEELLWATQTCAISAWNQLRMMINHH
jgi:hypothetical protein